MLIADYLKYSTALWLLTKAPIKNSLFVKNIVLSSLVADFNEVVVGKVSVGRNISGFTPG